MQISYPYSYSDLMVAIKSQKTSVGISLQHRLPDVLMPGAHANLCSLRRVDDEICLLETSVPLVSKFLLCENFYIFGVAPVEKCSENHSNSPHVLTCSISFSGGRFITVILV